MIVVIASDEQGFDLKQQLAREIADSKHDVYDFESHSHHGRLDYPDYARSAIEIILTGRADRGVLIDESGVGVVIAANKAPGIRAGLCHDTHSVQQGVEHDDMNVLCLGSRIIGPDLGVKLLRMFLGCRYCGGEVDQERLAKLAQLEGDVRAGMFESLTRMPPPAKDPE